MLSSPLRSRPAPVGSPEGEMGRLDRLLQLVTEHEGSSRDQDMRLADVAQRLGQLETRMSQAPLCACKDRNIPMELDLARSAVEGVVRQLAATTKANQVLQAELRSSQQKQAQQQAAHEAVVATLAADMAALVKCIDQLRSTTRQQLEAHAAEQDEQLQSLQRETASKQSQAVAASTQAAAAVRELEASTKAEMLQLASNQKAVVQSFSNHQQQTSVQMEVLLLQWDNSSAAVEALQQQGKSTRKHVARLQQQAEELQRATAEAALNATALERLQSELSHLGATQQQLSERVEAAASCSSSAGRQVQDLSQHLSEVSHVVESVAGCLLAARAQAAAAPVSSYLSTLLGPAVPPQPSLASLATAAAGAGGASGKHLAAWMSHAPDERLAHVDTWVRRQQQHRQPGRGGCSSSCTAASPPRSPGRAQHHRMTMRPSGPCDG